jgi:NAD(P)-dependent dehydrogenase (short-subunit alcohol dehydrogenase family)
VDDEGTHAAYAAPERSRDDEHVRTEKAVTETEQKVAIITGGSQGIGAGLVDAYRQRRWAIVANSLSIKPSKDPDILTVRGDVSEQATADRIMSQALDRFSRVDTLANNAGVFVSKPFTDYTA